MNKMRKLKKRGVSPVIATVMIILITFVAVGVLWGFILPMVRQGLEEGASCFELRDYLTVVSGDYTCYDDTPQTKVMIERGLDNYTIQGITASITFEGESRRYDIKVVGSTSGVAMLGGGDVQLPNPGEARTYVFSGIKGERVELGVISGGTTCELGTYNIPRCPIS